MDCLFYWNANSEPKVPCKPAGMPDVPLSGTENWCLTRKLSTDAYGVSGKWTLSAVEVYEDRFVTTYPNILGSIPHFTMPISTGCVSSAV
jgi:hypothetical protein